MSSKLIDACPHLLPSSLSSLSFDGFINVQGKDFRISISAQNNNRLQDTRYIGYHSYYGTLPLYAVLVVTGVLFT